MAQMPVTADPVHARREAWDGSAAWNESVAAAEPVVVTRTPARDVSGVYTEGLLVGLVGAATIAVWFLILDVLNQRPMYTPNLLGTALLRGGQGFTDPQALPLSLDMILGFTWVHVLAFLVIGVAASHLLALAEREPNFGFGVLLLFVVFQFGFLAVSTALAESVLNAFAWPEIVIGNLLAAAVMATMFWRRHPDLKVLP